MGKPACMRQVAGAEWAPSSVPGLPQTLLCSLAKTKHTKQWQCHRASCMSLDCCFVPLSEWFNTYFSSVTIPSLQFRGMLFSPNSLLMVGTWDAPYINHETSHSNSLTADQITSSCAPPLKHKLSWWILLHVVNLTNFHFSPVLHVHLSRGGKNREHSLM